jgi:site-specific recombinase XerD
MRATAFAKHLQDYFEVYLPQVKGFSCNTVSSYQDSFRLLFEYFEKCRRIKPYLLDYKYFSGVAIEEFLGWLESERNYCPSSRNQRLAAVSSFFKFASRKSIDALSICSQVLDIPAKKATRKPLSYFSLEEMQILLQMPNPQKNLERRDLVLLSLLYDSGARAQELCDLTVGDIRFGKPTMLHLQGKGGKARVVPILDRPTKLVRQYITENSLTGLESKTKPLFPSQTHEKMTSSCIRNIIEKYVSRAKSTRPDLFCAPAYSPHSTRHSKAVHMLEAGVDLIYIRDFLGHSSVQTTEIYAQVSQSLVTKTLLERKIPQLEPTDRMSKKTLSSIPAFLLKR